MVLAVPRSLLLLLHLPLHQFEVPPRLVVLERLSWLVAACCGRELRWLWDLRAIAFHERVLLERRSLRAAALHWRMLLERRSLRAAVLHRWSGVLK